MLQFIDISLGHSNATCARCGPPGAEDPRAAREVIAEIAEVSDAWCTAPGPNIGLTGFEPFRHPDIQEIVDACVRMGADRIRLDTEARALTDAETSMSVLAAGVRHLRVVLLGATGSQHDSLASSPGSFIAALDGVQTFTATARNVNARVHVTALIDVCTHNLKAVPDTVTVAARTGVSDVLIRVSDPSLDLRSAAPWLEAACDTGIVNAVWVEVEGIPFGMATGWELHLASTYRAVHGRKAEVCLSCALVDVCSGAVLEASDRILETFQPPACAELLCEQISRGFDSPMERCGHV
ncbi:MAG: hypothetical protein HY876_01270 [Coriobacteriales bacterium]|nr:hypothetical protein [Coriobacteriales bacterium]